MSLYNTSGNTIGGIIQSDDITFKTRIYAANNRVIWINMSILIPLPVLVLANKSVSGSHVLFESNLAIRYFPYHDKFHYKNLSI